MSEQQNRVALVTGSGRRRIGNIVAKRLAASGYRIALHYHRSRAEAEATVSELRAMEIDCEAFQADVSDESQVERMFESVIARFQRIDVLVTTASVWSPRKLEAVTGADMLDDFKVNGLGTFLCARSAGLIMVDQAEGGAIVTVGDWAIERPYLDHAPYFVSKGSIPTMTRMLAVELAHRNPNVRVNCIKPGPVMFPEDTTSAQQAELVDSTLVKRANCPESVAEAVLFLIHNQFVTGTSIPIDGGRTIFAGEWSRGE